MAENRKMDTESSTGSCSKAPIAQLHSFFRDGFTASDIAEPLVSWDAVASVEIVASKMQALDFDVAGVRIGGGVAGWIERTELTEGRCVDHLQSFFAEGVVSSRTPLREVIELLGSAPRLFVTAFGAVGGIITQADLQKAPVRMWLFGLVTLVEDTFTRILKEHFPGDSWHGELSASRLERARKLHAERARRNQHLDLVDCLQFADKGHVLFKNERVRERLGFPSRVRAKEVVRNLEKLRNNLAHTQDIVAENLETIVNLASAMDRVLDYTI